VPRETAAQHRAVHHAGAGRPCLRTYWSAVGGSQTRDQTTAAEHPRARVLGEGAAIPQAWAGGGPREGCLAGTRWADRGACEKWLACLSPSPCLALQRYVSHVEHIGAYVCVPTGAAGPCTVRSSAGSSPSETPAPSGRACRSSWWRHLCAPITPGPCECHTLPSAHAWRNCGAYSARGISGIISRPELCRARHRHAAVPWRYGPRDSA
jgi:hypothetical protein